MFFIFTDSSRLRLCISAKERLLCDYSSNYYAFCFASSARYFSISRILFSLSTSLSTLVSEWLTLFEYGSDKSATNVERAGIKARADVGELMRLALN